MGSGFLVYKIHPGITGFGGEGVYFVLHTNTHAVKTPLLSPPPSENSEGQIYYVDQYLAG